MPLCQQNKDESRQSQYICKSLGRESLNKKQLSVHKILSTVRYQYQCLGLPPATRRSMGGWDPMGGVWVPVRPACLKQ